MATKYLSKFAETVLKIGVNLQEDQILIISAPIHTTEYVHELAKKAYEMGARRVVFDYRDDEATKLRLENESVESLTSFFDYEVEAKTQFIHENCCRVAIVSEDPEIFSHIDPTKMAERTKAWTTATKSWMAHQMSNGIRWCVVAVPEKAWAKKIFPNESSEVACEKLWDMIAYTMRLDKEDPIKEWQDFAKSADKRAKFLNDAHVKTVHYENSLGTDLYVDMMDDSIWLSAQEKAKDGVPFIANLPTEEIFSAPHKNGANGVLYSARPLVYNGNIIDKFKLVFKDGRIVDYTAETGFETLKSIIETDEGSHYLGEIALVQYDSPISNLKTLFYETLFDENASCHFAMGKGYTSCTKSGETLSEEELFEHGLNESLTHEDFMVGTHDLKITATTFDGKEFLIMKDGNFVI